MGGFRVGLADVAGHIFAAYVREIRQGAKPEAHQLVVDGVQFAQSWDMEGVPEKGEIAFKGATAGNQPTGQMGKGAIADF